MTGLERKKKVRSGFWKMNRKSLCAAILLALGLAVQAECIAAQEAIEQGEAPTFTLEGITVEAKRPDWEAKLSPGTVTVIRPQDFKGEQKTLPDMLKTVPGARGERARAVYDSHGARFYRGAGRCLHGWDTDKPRGRCGCRYFHHSGQECRAH